MFSNNINFLPQGKSKCGTILVLTFNEQVIPNVRIIARRSAGNTGTTFYNRVYSYLADTAILTGVDSTVIHLCLTVHPCISYRTCTCIRPLSCVLTCTTVLTRPVVRTVIQICNTTGNKPHYTTQTVRNNRCRLVTRCHTLLKIIPNRRQFSLILIHILRLNSNAFVSRPNYRILIAICHIN